MPAYKYLQYYEVYGKFKLLLCVYDQSGKMVLTIIYYFLILKNVLQGTFCIASWRGIQVAVKKLGEEFFIDEEKVWVGYMWQINFLLLILCLLSLYLWPLILFIYWVSCWFSERHSGMSLLYFKRYATQMSSSFLVLWRKVLQWWLLLNISQMYL